MSTRLSIVVQPLLLILRVASTPYFAFPSLSWRACDRSSLIYYLRQRYSVCMVTFRCMARRNYKDSEHITYQFFFRRAFQHEKQPGLNIMYDGCIKNSRAFILQCNHDLYGSIIAIRLLLDDLLYHTQAAATET